MNKLPKLKIIYKVTYRYIRGHEEKIITVEVNSAQLRKLEKNPCCEVLDIEILETKL